MAEIDIHKEHFSLTLQMLYIEFQAKNTVIFNMNLGIYK